MDTKKLYDALNKYMHYRSPEEHALVDQAARHLLGILTTLKEILK